MATVNVTVDAANKEIKIYEKYDISRARAYLDLAKTLNEELVKEELLTYSVVFSDRKFKNILDMATRLVLEHTKKVEALENPKPDTQHYKDLGIKDINYTDQLVILEDCELAYAIKLISHIPTLLGFKVQIGKVTYTDLSAIAKIFFANKEESPDNLVLSLTNDLLEEVYQLSKDEDFKDEEDE